MEEKSSSLAIPVAIIIAGIIIAGAIYFSNKNSSATPANQNLGNEANPTINTGDIVLNPISSKEYVRGNPNAKVVIVEFSDTECPYCKVFHGTMKNLVDKFAKDGTIAWVYRNFPIVQRHPKAPKEAEALLCAGKVGGGTAFWNYTDRLYAVTNSNNSLDLAQLPTIAKDVNIDVAAFNTCLSSGEMAKLVTLDYEDGVKAGGTGTPFNVFIAQKAFDKAAVEKFLIENILKYKFPVDLFKISSDAKMMSVSGAMPASFMEELIGLLTK